MSSIVILDPPGVWSNQELVLYHGTVESYAAALTSQAVAVSKGRPSTDFGPGFYTTTAHGQARYWAAEMSAKIPGAKPAVIRFRLSRDALAQLETLAFVRGLSAAEDYWSFVHFCRRGATHHARSGDFGAYDVVYGPVSAFWRQKVAMPEGDQISFHTAAAEAVLNQRPAERIV